jgi:hypothetical protein
LLDLFFVESYNLETFLTETPIWPETAGPPQGERAPFSGYGAPAPLRQIACNYYIKKEKAKRRIASCQRAWRSMTTLHSNLDRPFDRCNTLRLPGDDSRLVRRETMKHLRVNLKICEGCGALWLRASTVDRVYCRGCLTRLADFPVHDLRKHWPKRHRTCSEERTCGGEQ